MKAIVHLLKAEDVHITEREKENAKRPPPVISDKG